MKEAVSLHSQMVAAKFGGKAPLILDWKQFIQANNGLRYVHYVYSGGNCRVQCSTDLHEGLTCRAERLRLRTSIPKVPNSNPAQQ